MRLTNIINLPVVFLALVIGAAAAPSGVNQPGRLPLVKGPSTHFFLFLFLLVYSPITVHSNKTLNVVDKGSTGA